MASDLGGDPGGNVMICHHPPGNPSNAQTITVGQAAVAAHLAHGDSLGACPPACAGVPSPVPKTGQTTCWNELGIPIDCVEAGRQDGEVQKGAFVSPRFADNNDGTVTDNLTGLVWLKDGNCFGWRDWTTALSDANTLAGGSCGLTDGSVEGDWRLPNRKELQSLVDYGQLYPALPPGHPFAEVQSGALYWSSTTFVDSPYAAWGVGLDDGAVNAAPRKGTGLLLVWPVRGGPEMTLCQRPPGNPGNAQTITMGQSAVPAHLRHGDSLSACPPACQCGVPSPVPKTGQTGCWDQDGNPIDCAGTGQDGEYQRGVSADPRFTDNNNGTVTDNLTGLIWLKNASCFGGVRDWWTALGDASSLASGTCGLTDGSVEGDWRLPNVKELQSLIDLGQVSSALPLGHPFTGVASYVYWSSTTSVDAPYFAWIVYSTFGTVSRGQKILLPAYDWPVRGGP